MKKIKLVSIIIFSISLFVFFSSKNAINVILGNAKLGLGIIFKGFITNGNFVLIKIIFICSIILVFISAIVCIVSMIKSVKRKNKNNFINNYQTVCPSCQNICSGNDIYCFNCGAKLLNNYSNITLIERSSDKVC